MTYFLHQPSGIFLRTHEQLINVGTELEVGTYVVNVTPQGEFFLSKIDNFSHPKKLYGSVAAKANRIFSTFQDRTASTGVLLSGEQGSGKTMLSRELSLLGLAQGISTIIVNSPFSGAEFNQFMQAIDVPAIVIFDEFEKQYDDEGQEKLLTLLDGLFPSKKMFVLTCNNVYRIDQHLLNRPGRIFYHLQYEGLESSFVREYCEDTLKDQKQIVGVEKVSKFFNAFNFDMLKALVEEMNRFNIPAAEAIELMNIMPTSQRVSTNYAIELLVDGKEVTKFSPTQTNENPVYSSLELYIQAKDDEEVGTKKRGALPGTKPINYVEFLSHHLVSMNDGVYQFKNDRCEIRLTPIVNPGFDFKKHLAF